MSIYFPSGQRSATEQAYEVEWISTIRDQNVTTAIKGKILICKHYVSTKLRVPFSAMEDSAKNVDSDRTALKSNQDGMGMVVKRMERVIWLRDKAWKKIRDLKLW
jgi:hypothetical protein